MVAKPQRSIRFDNEAYNGLLRVQLPDENFTATVNRVLLVGVDAIERESRKEPDEAQNEAQANPNESQTGHDDPLSRYIQRLEDENARLMAEHEADRAAIAEKDKQIYEALARAQELASQSNAVALAAQDAKRIPATTAGEEITVVMNDEETTQEPTDEEQAEKPVEEQDGRGWFARHFW